MIRNLLGRRSVMETFYIAIAIAAISGFCVWFIPYSAAQEDSRSMKKRATQRYE
jgi:hypothetical protein